MAKMLFDQPAEHCTRTSL